MVAASNKIALACMVLAMAANVGCNPAAPLAVPALRRVLPLLGGQPGCRQAKFPECRSLRGTVPTAHRLCSTSHCRHPADQRQ